MSGRASRPPVPFDVATAPLPAGLSLVEASAGAGKTFNLALSVVRLLVEDGPTGPMVGGVGRILVVTFTNAATDELINRIRRVLRLAVEVCSGAPVDEDDGHVRRLREIVWRRPDAEARLRAALAAVDTLSVFTIHGFAKRILDDFALESGTAFGATLLEDEAELVQEAMHDWWRRTFYTNPALAQLAVSRKLTPASFLADYQTLTNWPGATLEPGETLAEVQPALQAAVQAFVAAWEANAFAARALALTWNRKAPCATAAQIEAIDRAVQAARGRRIDDPAVATLLPIITTLTATELAASATKRSAAQKAQVAGLAAWPECAAATTVAEEVARQHLALRTDCLRTVQQAVAHEKARRHAIGFGDLLERLHAVLEAQGPEGLLATTVRAQFDAAMIDEFQDTDARQFRIFTTLFAERPLLLIGDPKQAIYGFRGADVQAYLTAVSLTPPERRYTLQRNFRSTGDMVQAVNQLFGRRRHPFLQHGIGYPPATADKGHPLPATLPGGHALELLWLAPGEEGPWWSGGEAERVSFTTCVNEIVDLLKAGWSPHHLAVLVRTGREGRAIEALLRAANVPAVVSGMEDIFKSAEMEELHRLLLAMATPRQAPLVRAALATDLWGATHEDLQALLAPEAAEAWDAVLNSFTRWRERWARDGLMSMLQACCAERRVFERLLALPDGDRRVTNLRHAMELVHAAAVEQRLHLDGVLRWLAVERATDHRQGEATELRLETDADAVQIVTVHKSKGLEYDIVFCPSLGRGRLVADPPVVVSEASGTVFDHGSSRLPERLAVANAARLAEDLRLLYVALTRARFRTYVTWGSVVQGAARSRDACLRTDGSIHSALGYLLLSDPAIDDLPAEAIPMHAAGALFDGVSTMPDGLATLARESRGRMAVRTVTGVVGGARWTPTAAGAPAPVARELPAAPPPSQRFRTFSITSYTALASGRGAGSDVADAVARDVDAPPLAGGGPAIPADALRALPRSDFRAFPAGPKEGTVLHRLFETSGFAESPAQRRPRVARLLQWHQLADSDDDARIGAVTDMMTAVYTTPFSTGGTRVRLADVTGARARPEWQFTLPMGRASAPLTASVLADAFRQSADPALRAYADAVQALPMRRVFGFLQGFVDLVFEHEGRWWVVDWKSNRLPLDPGSYRQEELHDVMVSHHYLLQASLYLVAVRRFLRTRASGPVAPVVGGAAYAFLRGFGHEVSATGHGWYTMPADPAVLDALDDILGPGDRLLVPA